jgi:hypothetical protein
VIAKNPFAKRPGIEPSKMLVWFLAGDSGPEARENVLQIKTDPEELRIADRETLHIRSQRNGAAEDSDGAD